MILFGVLDDGNGIINDPEKSGQRFFELPQGVVFFHIMVDATHLFEILIREEGG